MGAEIYQNLKKVVKEKYGIDGKQNKLPSLNFTAFRVQNQCLQTCKMGAIY